MYARHSTPHLQKIMIIRKYLSSTPLNMLKWIIHSFVTSRFILPDSLYLTQSPVLCFPFACSYQKTFMYTQSSQTHCKLHWQRFTLHLHLNSPLNVICLVSHRITSSNDLQVKFKVCNCSCIKFCGDCQIIMR